MFQIRNKEPQLVQHVFDIEDQTQPKVRVIIEERKDGSMSCRCWVEEFHQPKGWERQTAIHAALRTEISSVAEELLALRLAAY